VQYREYPAPLSLRPWLECLWERGGDGGSPVRVLPDGCIDVVWSSRDGARIVGANTTAFRAAVTAEEHLIGARLRPGGAPALIGVQAELVRDERPAIENVLGDSGARLGAELEVAADPVARLRGWLADRAAASEHPDRLVAETARRLDATPLAIATLAGELGVSERALRRRVRTAVGYGPKRLGRVLRLARALAAARAGEDLGRVAFDAGYADQAHFTGDCRELAGIPPSALLAESA
jgi:AraC-like DNA-binding protein